MSQTDGPGADCKSVAREFDSFLVHMECVLCIIVVAAILIAIGGAGSRSNGRRRRY